MKTYFCSIQKMLAAFFLLALCNTAWAWNAAGHMMVAAIAEPRLNAHAKLEIEKLLDVSVPLSERSKDFIQASHWADDVRALHEFDFAKNMHFIDDAFSPDATPLPDHLPYEVNIVNALKQYVAILKESDRVDEKRAEALRFIIHFVGDIHQPLHCISRVTGDRPFGDKGGNDFQIFVEDDSGRKKTMKLHRYWDGGIGSFPKSGEGFSPPALAEILPVARDIQVSNPDSIEDWKGAIDFQAWARESHELALSVSYQGIVERTAPDQVYIDRSIQTVHHQIARAGYRLAALLNEVWP